MSDFVCANVICFSWRSMSRDSSMSRHWRFSGQRCSLFGRLSLGQLRRLSTWGGCEHNKEGHRELRKVQRGTLADQLSGGPLRERSAAARVTFASGDDIVVVATIVTVTTTTTTATIATIQRCESTARHNKTQKWDSWGLLLLAASAAALTFVAFIFVRRFPWETNRDGSFHSSYVCTCSFSFSLLSLSSPFLLRQSKKFTKNH